MISIERALQLQPDIIEIRRHLHSRPELSFAEHQTADLAAEYLSRLGFDIQRGIAKTGFIANKGSRGKTVAIRADMDALPIQEANNVPYKSQHAGVMHACGHDAHVACALAAAKLLSEIDMPGRLRLVMQPAEETTDEHGLSGAAYMVQEGALQGVDAVIGMHVSSLMPSGTVNIRSGPIMASADSFRIKIKGKGGHGGYPESTIDPVVIAAQIIQAIQCIVSRRISPVEPVVISVGSISTSSQRGNIISDSVEMLGTARSFSEETRARVREEVTRACSLAESFGASFELAYEYGYPATVNHPYVADVVRHAAQDLIGADCVQQLLPRMAADDFGVMAQSVPGAYMFLGVKIDGDNRNHHSATFDLDESVLHIGAAVLAEAGLRLMSD